jgi:hypothetical protein
MGSETTSITLFGLSLTIGLSLLLLLLPRRYGFIPFIIAVCYLTFEERISILGLNFYMLRILVVAGWVRVLVRGELGEMKWNSFDWLITIWVLYGIISFTLLYSNFEALINRLGFGFNALGAYALFRVFVPEFDDVKRVCKWASIIIIPLTGIMLFEYLTGRNLFFTLGDAAIGEIRDGRIRCSGPFRHPIMSGSFGAALMPLFIAQSRIKPDGRKIGLIGFICSTIIVVISGSSGPLLSYIFGFGAMIAWVLRRHIRMIQWGLIFFLIGLQLMMKAPIYYLMARFGNVHGGHGWHRSYLIEQAIAHFNEWWLIGTTYTAHWMPFGILPNDPNMVDITNQYILEGINGGIVNLLLFVSIIIVGYKQIGRALRKGEKPGSYFQFFVWAIGASLSVHVVNFFSVSYFDQIFVIWCLLLSMINAVGNEQNIKESSL